MAPVTPSLGAARRLVVKVGSTLLVDRGAGLRSAWLGGLAADVAHARGRGTQVILVSSGAIALGRDVLGLPGGFSYMPLTAGGALMTLFAIERPALRAAGLEREAEPSAEDVMMTEV